MTEFLLAKRARGGSRQTYEENGPINVVIMGDSVSHGAVNGYFNYHTVYHNRLRLMIGQKYPAIPVNMINTAVGGKCARHGFDHFERDVLPHRPDLVIVCYGLNDVNASLEEYIEPLAGIFQKCRENGLECIFMTPNMLNTYVSEDTADGYRAYAQKTMTYQTEGRMDRYMAAAIETALSHGIPVCDCYAKWKALAASGTDTTMLLANRINHPAEDMHRLFADALYEMLFGTSYDGKSIHCSDDAMYQDQ